MKWLPKIRFSMRTLFIIVTLLCVVLGPLSVKLYQARQQRLAVEGLPPFGGRIVIHYDYNRDKEGNYVHGLPTNYRWLRSILGNDFFDTVVFVRISEPTATDISNLTQLQSVESIILVDPQDVDLSLLGSLKNLNSLDITFSSEKSYTANNLAELSKLDCSLIVQIECPTTVQLEGEIIDSLTPIQHLRNIRELTIRSTQNSGLSEVSDLTPLVHLDQLEVLSIWHCPVKDISALSNLSSLKSLVLYGTEIDDFSPLSDLTQLEELRLDGHNVSDLRALAKLVNLRDLRLSCYIAKDLPELKYLAPLQNLVKLEKLYLDPGYATDLSPLSSLINLRELTLDTEATDLSPLSNLTQLEHLNLKDWDVTDLAPLAKLINLRFLELNTPEANDLPLLDNLVDLEDLYIWEVPNITDLTPLAKLINLRLLWLIDLPKAVDLAPLQNLVNLEELHHEDSNVADLTPLANMTNLQTLRLGTKAQDLSPLFKLLKLSDINLEYTDTQVPKAEVKKLEKALPDCWVDVYLVPE